tara:strand:+ start:1320 stop:1703 length:384 start_codon:yes stop_codon:yes gene_type:complete
MRKMAMPFCFNAKEAFMKNMILTAVTLVTLAGCVAPAASPMEAAARRAAGAEIVARQCAGYAGGYSSVKTLREDASKNVATARNLGATDAVIAKARNDMQTGFNTMVAFTTPQEACNKLIGELAWVG